LFFDTDFEKLDSQEYQVQEYQVLASREDLVDDGQRQSTLQHQLTSISKLSDDFNRSMNLNTVGQPTKYTSGENQRPLFVA